MNSTLLFSTRIFATKFFVCSIMFSLQAQIHYVKSDAAGLGNGSSWQDGFVNLQNAIDVANPGDSIWVAAGTYFPTTLHLGDSARNSTFYINKDIKLFGGFDGADGSEGDFSPRNPKTNLTILSGDIGTPGDDADNVFHVVYIDHASDTARIDGFTITKGNGIGGALLEGYGAGIYNDAIAGRSNPTIANCIISDNIASEFGGGMANYADQGGVANPILLHCAFLNNAASGGGGIGNYTEGGGEASPVLISCTLSGNTAPTGQGGAMQCIAHSATSSPRMINCIVTGNHSPSSQAVNCFVTGTGVTHPVISNSAFSGNSGGALRVSDLGAQLSGVTVRNSIFWKNGFNHGLSSSLSNEDVKFSIMQFGFNGEGNIGLDPLFVNEPPILDEAHTQGDLHILPGSPALDAGSDVDVPAGILTDYDSHPRFINSVSGGLGTVDIGPFETKLDITNTREILPNTFWKIYPNPTISQVIISLSTSIDNGKIHITDVWGHMLRSVPIANQLDQVIDVSDLSSGTYFITLSYGHYQAIKKIIIP